MIPLVGNTFPLFDKIINVELMQKTGETTYIETPKIGRKPTINVSGKILPSPILSDIDLRMTNLITGDVPLDAYKYLKIQAGYAGSLNATIQAEVVNAYQETPGPDGITVFKMLLGGFTNWTNVTISNQWNAGTQLKTVLQFLAQALSLTLQSTLPDSMALQSNWAFTGLAKDFIAKIAQTLNINIYPSGPFLVAFAINGNTGVEHVIRYLITPPRHEAYGYNFTAPWDPTLRPGDICIVDSRYMRQTYGGAQVSGGQTMFVAQTVSFDFGTTDDTNSMIVLAVSA